MLLFDGAQAAYTAIAAGEIADVAANPAAALAALIVLVGFAPLGIFAYYRTRAVNSAFDELQLGAHKSGAISGPDHCCASISSTWRP